MAAAAIRSVAAVVGGGARMARWVVRSLRSYEKRHQQVPWRVRSSTTFNMGIVYARYP